MIEPTPLPTPMPEDDDDALIRRVADGDTRAFEALHERYAPRLRGYLRAQLGQPDLADDACHEVLLIVWTTAERFQHASQLSTWIYGIAWRVANRMRTKAHPYSTLEAAQAPTRRCQSGLCISRPGLVSRILIKASPSAAWTAGP